MKILKIFKKLLSKKDKKDTKRKKIIFFVILILGLFNIYNISENYFLKQEISKYEIEERKIKIDRIYFNQNSSLNDYSETKYKIEKLGKVIIENIRNVHKSPVLISKEFQNKELCAGYIGELSSKIWGNSSIYSIGLQNTKKGKRAQAWELPYYYEAFGGKILIDFSEYFSLEEKNYIEKIELKEIKEFFAKTFSEKALFGDIGFLYSKTKYTNFLKNWSSNSHITKNMGVSDFELVISKFDKSSSNLENFMTNLGCDSKFNKYIDLLENYKMFLNNKHIIFYEKDFYYINKDNSLGKKVFFKYLDNISYKDITIAHFFEGKSHVDSLFGFSCKLEFFPINVISINGRMIEKM